MYDCEKEKKRAIGGTILLLCGTLLIIVVTKYINILIMTMFGIYVGIHSLILGLPYIDCIYKK